MSAALGIVTARTSRLLHDIFQQHARLASGCRDLNAAGAIRRPRARAVPPSAVAGPAADLLADFQARLQALADEQVRAAQDAYFKNVILHRGVKTPGVEAACKAFLKQTAADTATLRQLGLALMRQQLQEDKVAGMLLLRHVLLRGGGADMWRDELAALQQLYTDGHVFAWSTSDGICGHLLAPLIKRLLAGGAPGEGQACGECVLAWHRQGSLWLRRSSVVTFVTLARLPDEEVFPGFRAGLLQALRTTVRSQERFEQTGTGWVLRELGKGDADEMLRFVEANLAHFSREGLRYALERQDADVLQPLLARHKQMQQAAGVWGKAGAARTPPQGQTDAGGAAEREAEAAPAAGS